MITAEKLFKNFFDAKGIIPIRLLLFAKDLLQRLKKGNTANQFTAIIAVLTPQIAALEAEIGNADVSLLLQKGKTQTVDGVMESFASTLSELEGVIAHALGGRHTNAYEEFFPYGLTEYGKATHETMPVLTNRISKAAASHTAQLGATITAQLQAFSTSYAAARDAQETAKSELGDHKRAKGTNEANLEIGLVTAVHTVGLTYPGDVAKCGSFFNFNLLYSHPRHKHDVHQGDLKTGETQTVLNATLTDSAEIVARNKGTNANIQLWLGLTAADPAPATAIDLAPGETHVLKPSDLGDLANTFLLVANDSTVNDASFEVVVIR